MRKKWILRIALLAVMAACLSGCIGRSQEMTGQAETRTAANKATLDEYFTTVTKGCGYQIIYANDTKVLYFIHSQGHQYGITPLYNADGTLQVYEESEADDAE